MAKAPSNHPSRSQPRLLLRRQTQLAQNAAGVLPQPRHAIHSRRERSVVTGRQQRRQFPAGAVHFPPAIAGLELRVIPHALHVIDPGIGDLRVFQALDDLLDRQRGKTVDDDLPQRFTVLRALEVGREPLVRRQRRVQQDLLAE
ncbi:hypothetical protein D3C84_991810 [compost metagenome]